MPEKDYILVQKTLAGDRNAFGDLVERYGALVHGVILETVRQLDPVEDLVQEVFCKAYENLSTLRQPARFAAWMARMATNQAVSWLREQKTRHRVEAESQAVDLIHYPRPPDELFETREEEDLLWAALDRLPPEYRRLVVLYYLENGTQQEMARFLDLSLTTVQWRLFKARRSLEREVKEALYRKVGYRSGVNRKLRKKVLSSLPLIPFFRPAPSRAWTLVRRVMVFFGLAGVAGWLGLALPTAWQEQGQEGRREERAGFRVQYRPQELPAMSVFWEPRQPKPGERVRIEVAGMEVAVGEAVALHYITDPVYPQERVVEMRPEGETWQAEIEIPLEAATVFFYASPAAQSAPDSVWGGDYPFYRKKKRLQPYTHSLVVFDARGRPLRGAALDQARMAQVQDRPEREILGYLDQEIARYPDHWEAYDLRWDHLLRLRGAAQEAETRVRIQAELQALQARFPDEPELLYKAVQRSSSPAARARLCQELYERFPEYEKADEAAYDEAFYHLTTQDTAGYVAALERFMAAFPESPFLYAAHWQRLDILKQSHPERAENLADSLIRGTLVVPYAPDKAKTKPVYLPNKGGALLKAKAYSVCFELYLSAGDAARAIRLARRLIESGLPDPLVYFHIGEQLSGQENTRGLAIEMLEAGLGWAEPESILALPGFSVYEGLHAYVQVQKREELRMQARALCWGYWLELGRCYLEEGRYGQAAESLRAAVSFQEGLCWPETEKWEEDAAYLMLGAALEALGEWEAAGETYEQLVQAFYFHPQAEVALAHMYRARYGNTAGLSQKLTALCPMAPDFRLQDVWGEKVRLAGLRGRPVLLYYDGYLYADHLQGLERWNQRFRDQGLVVLDVSGFEMVSVDGTMRPMVERMRELVGEPGYSLRFLMDDDEVYGKYQVKGSELFLIDREGRLRLRMDWRVWEQEELREQVERKIEEVAGEVPPISLTSRGQ